MADLSQFSIKAQDNSKPEFTLLPKGYYKVVALKEDLKQTQAGTGSYISVEFEVLDNKRKLWANYNIVNPNKKAEEIAHRDLESFAWAVGLQSLRNSEELLFKELQVYVDIDAGKNGYKDQNVIRGYYPAPWTIEQIDAHRKAKTGAGTSVPPTQATNAPAVGGAAAVGAGASPWARK